MGSNNAELLWYGLFVVKAVLTLFFVSVVGLLCKRFLRCIPCNRVKRRSAKHPMVHSLDIVQPPRKAADPGSCDIKKRIG